MKKINLKNLNLDSKDILTKEQLINVLGGGSIPNSPGVGAGCSVACSSGYYACCESINGVNSCRCVTSMLFSCTNGGQSSCNL